MKKLLIILAICLITSLAFASIRMIGQGPIRVGSGGIHISKPSVDLTGTYWTTAYGAMWTEAYATDSRWTETYNMGI